MILDAKNLFSDQQAVTATARSTNVIDMVAASRDLGVGEQLFVALTVQQTFAAAGAATLTVTLETDDNAGFSSTAVIASTAAIPKATLVAAMDPIYIPLPPGAWERYVSVNYTVATGPFTAGTISAHLVKNIQRAKTYPANFVTAS